MRASRAHDITSREHPVVVPERILERRPHHVSDCAAGGGHHYLIESPNGPTVDGRCRKCGKSRFWVTDPLGGAGRFESNLNGTVFGVAS